MSAHQMPERIVRHSKTVCAVALHLSCKLNEQGFNLDRELVQASAMLHDITKKHSLGRRLDHALTGAKLLKNLGYPQIASVVRQHVRLSPSRPPGRVSEIEVVHYADKRVVDDRITTLTERMDYIRRRYCRTPESLFWLKQWSAAALELEREIFSVLPEGPEQLLHLDPDVEGSHL